MPRVTFDPSVSVVVVDCLLEAADGASSLVIPVVLDTGASFTVVATDILVHLGYDPANPLFTRQLSARSARPTIDYKAAS